MSGKLTEAPGMAWYRDERRMAWFRSDGAYATDAAIMGLPDATARELVLLVLGEATTPAGRAALEADR